MRLGAVVMVACCAWAAAAGCTQSGVIGMSGESLTMEAPLLGPSQLPDAGVPVTPPEAGAPAPPDPGAPAHAPVCAEDCAARGMMCDPELRTCVGCSDGHCDRGGPGPSCDPQRFDCRCQRSGDCPEYAPVCFDGQCRRCSMGWERAPECGPRGGPKCSGRNCPDAGPSDDARDSDGRDPRNRPQVDAGR